MYLFSLAAQSGCFGGFSAIQDPRAALGVCPDLLAEASTKSGHSQHAWCQPLDQENTGGPDPAEDTEDSHVTREHKQSLPEVVPRGDGLCVFVVQTVEVIVWVTVGGSFIKVTVPFDMDPYHTTLDTRDRVNARVMCRWTEVAEQPFRRPTAVSQRSGRTTLYTQISGCPQGSLQLSLMMPRG